MGHAEVAPDVLLDLGALLVADEHDPPAVDGREAADDGRVVAEQPVAVQLDDVVGHRAPAAPACAAGGRCAPAGRAPRRLSRSVVGIGRGVPCRATTGGLNHGRPSASDRPSAAVTTAAPFATPVRGRARPGSVAARGWQVAAAAPASVCAQLGARSRPGRRSRGRTGTRSAGSPRAASSPIVPAATRAPAKPMSALGSARLTSPRAANEAKTPPVVGSVIRLMYGTPAVREPAERGARLAPAA